MRMYVFVAGLIPLLYVGYGVPGCSLCTIFYSTLELEDSLVSLELAHRSQARLDFNICPFSRLGHRMVGRWMRYGADAYPAGASLNNEPKSAHTILHPLTGAVSRDGVRFELTLLCVDCSHTTNSRSFSFDNKPFRGAVTRSTQTTRHSSV